MSVRWSVCLLKYQHGNHPWCGNNAFTQVQGCGGSKVNVVFPFF